MKLNRLCGWVLGWLAIGGLAAEAVTLTGVANPTAGGYITPATTNVTAGAWLQLTATASNAWWRFTGWSDGTLNSPYTLQAPATDTVYTANFVPLAYVRTTVPGGGGTISGGGLVVTGQTVSLTAVPSANYMFTGWSDGEPNNPRQVAVTWPQGTTNTYTASFLGLLNGTLNITAGAGGTATGGGTYPVGQVVTISAAASNGFVFTQWNDNNSANPRQVTVVLGTTTISANFTNLVTITAAAELGGSTTGSGTYIPGAQVLISALPQSGWTFERWGDGNAANPRYVTAPVTSTVYVARFTTNAPAPGPTTVNVTVSPNPYAGGTATGGGVYETGSTQQLAATANFGWTFTGWSDGLTANPRTLIVPTNDAIFLANFTSNGATAAAITVVASPTNAARVYGGGSFSVGTTVQIGAAASNGWAFLRWNDGDLNNPRLVSVTGAATYTATFQPLMVDITAVASPAYGGTVSGGGSYRVDSYAALTATPATGWNFVRWSDGSVASSHAITVPAAGGTYTATFQPTLGTALGATGLTWTTGGNVAWAGQSAVNHDGKAAAQSGALADSQTSWIQTITNGPASVLFWWKVSSQTGDTLSFIVDESKTNQISGSVDWTQFAMFLGDGAHTCRWAYAKDAAGSAGSDAGWVGEVHWLPCPAATNLPQVLFQDPGGLVASWVVETNAVFQFTRLLGNTATWQLKTSGDVDGDGTTDLVFQSPAGEVVVWFMNSDGTTRGTSYLGNTGAWQVRACADFYADGHAGLFFQTAAGAVAYWQADTNGVPTNSVFLGNTGAWQLKTSIDLDHDNKAEVFWQTGAGINAVWFHTNTTIYAQLMLTTPGWELRGSANIDNDGIGDLLWQTPDGRTGGWFMETNATPRAASFWWNTGGWKLQSGAR